MAAISDDLKGQFQKLQKQQQQKLARRKMLKDATPVTGGVKSDTAASAAFGVDDDMGLQVRK